MSFIILHLFVFFFRYLFVSEYEVIIFQWLILLLSILRCKHFSNFIWGSFGKNFVCLSVFQNNYTPLVFRAVSQKLDNLLFMILNLFIKLFLFFITEPFSHGYQIPVTPRLHPIGFLMIFALDIKIISVIRSMIHTLNHQFLCFLVHGSTRSICLSIA